MSSASADDARGEAACGTIPVITNIFAVLTALVATAACAGDDEGSGRRASPVAQPSWEFALSLYPTFVRDGDNSTFAIAAADRGPLHLEARYNYESIGARSVFAGWTDRKSVV